ncbi:MAG: hypothetical protein NTY53_26790 [Kiritimatiellaeota bacterium]|nr:hypothetical protein [Kiritimatiellota bacterium]
MMTFFIEQGDFILCAQGFALIFLAVVYALMGQNVRLPMTWSWLGTFAFITGLSFWQEVHQLQHALGWQPAYASVENGEVVAQESAT